MGSANRTISWSKKQDGMYLQVDPSFVFNSENIEIVQRDLLRNKVVNANLARIQEILKLQSGQPEFVGPFFRVFDDKKRRYVKIKVTPELASINISGMLAESKLQLKLEDLEFLLVEAGVRYGLDIDILNSMLADEVLEEDVVVARYTPAIKGEDAKLIEVVTIDPDAKPLIKEDGSVDFRKLDTVKKIQLGNLIARKEPPTAGIAGTSVLGQKIVPEAGQDMTINPGKNTHVSPDGLELSANVDGYLYRDKGFICVGQLYIVSGDVDFHSGNIEYHGDVLVRGSVLADFSIKAGGSITIEKDIEAANLLAETGNIRIKGGVFGKGKCVIQAPKGIIETKFCQDCRLEAGRTLKVEKYLRNCSVQTGTLDVKNVGSHICGCDIHFHERILCYKMGTENGGKNTIYYVDDNIDGIEEKIRQMEKSLETLNIKLSQEELEIKRLRIQVPKAKAGSGLAVRLQDVLTAYKMNKRTQGLLQTRIATLKEQMVRPSTLERMVEMKYLLPLLEMQVFGKTKVFRESLSGLKIEWRQEDIVTRSTN